ncbi:cytochrome c peroxidase [Methylobacterium durans]|uniref:cytochrome-c peroxidase n=1 Tax=Methylobacterium durans TaxID=2202825 RepID=UPI002AFE8438|nr:cytochrome c peroxidase [Methylobacterium durans]MEA1835210.1 cytochrome c peroxidase [Methylobacterium durans]
MAWKVGGALASLLVLLWVSNSAAVGPASEHAPARQDATQREIWRRDYRAPAAIPFPESNPYTEAKAELGRRLFFDPILSGDRDRSCASCHVPNLGWADGRARAADLNAGDMDLRTPSLLNLAWQERLGWDGKFRTLESVSFFPINGPANMNLPTAEALRRLSEDEGYARAFAEAFPDPAVTKERVEAALATFERLIVSRPAPFDRWIAGDEGAIEAAAKRGFDLFNGKARCAACHSGWSFSDGSFHDIGTATGTDIGRGRFFPGSPALRYAFKTPGLREVSRRAPYMHDGAVPTLEAVIDLYDRGGIERPSRSPDIRPLGLAPSEKADLVAFLRTLSSEPGRVPALADLTADTPRP